MTVHASRNHNLITGFWWMLLIFHSELAKEKSLKVWRRLKSRVRDRTTSILITFITHSFPLMYISDPLVEMKNLITNNRYHIAEEEFYHARQFLADI